MKLLLLFIAIISAPLSQVKAQSPCGQFENNGFESPEAYFEDFKNALQINIPRLRQTRQWARKNNKPQIELATNRLEYWAKKYIQFIDKNKDKNMNAVCEKFEKEQQYISDFVQLSFIFFLTNGMNWENVEYSKYK